MTYDPLKAVREELVGLVEVDGTIVRRQRECEEAMAKAEVELNAVNKIRGYLQIEIARKRQVMNELVAAAEREGK